MNEIVGQTSNRVAATGTTRGPEPLGAGGRVLLAVRQLVGTEGITTQLQQMTEDLRARGWSVELVSAIDGQRRRTNPRIAWFERQGIPHHHVPFPKDPHTVRGSRDALRSCRMLSSLVQQIRPDLIHSYSLSLTPYLAWARMRHRVPFVSSCRMEIEQRGYKLRFRAGGLLNRWWPTFLGDRVVAISSEIKEEYHRLLHVPLDRIALIPNGVDTAFFRPPSETERAASRRAFEVPEEAFTVCIIGRLNPVKGHTVLIDAVARLHQEGRAVRLFIAGTGDWEAMVRQAIRDANLDDAVQMLGYVPARDVLWASDALVLPSLREGCANVIAEAMACGIVPVRTPTSGATDQVRDGTNGVIVPFGDAAAIARVLRQLHDAPEVRLTMGAAARQSAEEHFSREAIADRTNQLYHSILIGVV